MRKKETLRDRFDKKGFAVTAYARAHKLNKSTLSRVLSGELNGKNKPVEGGSVRKVIARLKSDGVWIGRLPWEHDGKPECAS